MPSAVFIKWEDQISPEGLWYVTEKWRGSEHGISQHNLEQGKTALMFAAQQRHQVRLGKLLDYEAQINNTTYYGATA